MSTPQAPRSARPADVPAGSLDAPADALDAPPADALEAVREAAAGLRDGRLDVARFAQIWRAQHRLLATLPPAFGAVMDDTLQRLESVSLFSEESCSFSQQDLLANVDVWIRKAQARLSRA